MEKMPLSKLKSQAGSTKIEKLFLLALFCSILLLYLVAKAFLFIPRSNQLSDNNIIYDYDYDYYEETQIKKLASNPLFEGIDPAVRKKRDGSEYWIYYNKGQDIYRRTSKDGITWGLETMVFPNGIYADVYKDGLTYRMVYSSFGDEAQHLQQIRLSFSYDGLKFREGGVLLEPGKSGEWDERYLADAYEIKIGDTYYLYYGGANRFEEYAIGLAISSTGLPGSYKKQGPVLTKSAFGFDSVSVFDAEVLRYDAGKYIMFYTGYNGEKSQIAYATSVDLIHWTKSSANPLYWISQEWEKDSTYGPNEPAVLIEDGVYRIWYRGNPGGTKNYIGYLVIPQDPITREPASIKQQIP